MILIYVWRSLIHNCCPLSMDEPNNRGGWVLEVLYIDKGQTKCSFPYGIFHLIFVIYQLINQSRLFLLFSCTCEGIFTNYVASFSSECCSGYSSQ